VAAAQLRSGADPAANLELVEVALGEAAGHAVDLVVFPEATMRAFGSGSLREVAEPLDGAWATRLRELADRHGICLAAGMFRPASRGRVFNTVLVVGPGIDTHYDKIHLFDAYGFRESDTVAPGEGLRIVEIAGVPVGFATCYDLRFPGLFTGLADAGAMAICVAASWGAGPGKVDQWELLVRARALDTTCAVVAAGQAAAADRADGTEADGAETAASPSPAPTGVGHSLAVSARGEVLARLGPAPGLLVTEVDLAAVSATRRDVPVLANRRY